MVDPFSLPGRAEAHLRERARRGARYEAGLSINVKPAAIQWALAELDRLRAKVAKEFCACCGDGLHPGPPPLCESCAPTFTAYSDGTAHCDHHEGKEP